MNEYSTLNPITVILFSCKTTCFPTDFEAESVKIIQMQI